MRLLSILTSFESGYNVFRGGWTRANLVEGTDHDLILCKWTQISYYCLLDILISNSLLGESLCAKYAVSNVVAEDPPIPVCQSWRLKRQVQGNYVSIVSLLQ